ncbi:FUSC family protein [Novosphingobium resinovorum]|uniref:FUSC family protein n=1 Tax=Novosphingobium resinovorum TaxID=158500 RepID=UPI002ED1F3CA|nr:FUSC family protein [Novosphingobium resinovorum]
MTSKKKLRLRTPFPPILKSELRALVTPGPRMADEWACVASVMLAIVLAHAIGAQMVSWAAFSAFVLLKSDVGETLVRGVMRIVGTLLGSGLALLVVPYAARSVPLAMIAAEMVGAIGLYGMLTARRAYAWLLFGLTFEMILFDKIERPDLDTLHFAQTRLLEVVAGTVACTVVSLTAGALAGKRWWMDRKPSPDRMRWHPDAARHASQAGLAIATLPLLHALFDLPELPQAAVTIMAVMIVPVAGIGASGFVPVSRRLLHRALGCIAGGGLAIVVLLSAQGNPAVLIAGTCIGIVIGRHIENGLPRVTYLGLQFTLAVLVVLVPDSYANAAIGPAFQRLLSVFVGMAVLEPVLLTWHFVAPRRKVPRDVPEAPNAE